MYGILANSTIVLGALNPVQYRNCPGQPTCPRWNGCISTGTNGGVFRLSCVTDYNGPIIGTAQASFFVDCADACSRRTGCTAFNMKDNFCYLLGMDLGVPRVSNNDVNAGTQVKPATEQEPAPGSSTCDTTINCPNDDYCRYTTNGKSYITRCNYDYYGGDIALGPTDSLADCANRCSTFAGCVAATWVGGICYLKNRDYNIVYNAFVDSGVIDAHMTLTIILAPLVILFIRSIYRIFFHPLSHIPGPILPKLTSLWLHYHAYVGDEASTIHKLHQRYGPHIRVSPNEVDISDADAITAIYVSKGGFPKAKCYANFDIDGHKTIFSTTDPEYRSPRAKAVLPLFSTKALRENENAIWGCVDRMVDRLMEEAKTKKPVNVLNLTRSLAVDAVSTHLFQENYNGVTERGPVLSVSAFVDAFVAVGRFFYLPNTAFAWLEWAITKFSSDQDTEDSMSLVDRFVATVVSNTTAKSTTYPGRLLAIGISDSEVKVQCKDLIFAGTDSTGMNLATIMRNLVLYPEKYQRLKQEVTKNAALGPDAQDAQALPYLNAVVKEGLRLSMANPTRLPHVVPAGGWTFKGTYFPSGSIIGCSAYELHYDPLVFPQPQTFNPERWLNPTEEMSKYWFAFGAGSRACIARNLATMELQFATERLAKTGVLDGAKTIQEEVEIYEWFNSKVKGGKIELAWG